MKRILWSRFLRRCFSSSLASASRTGKKRPLRAPVHPRLEHLEDRITPSNVYVVDVAGDAGTGSGLTGDIRYCIDQADQVANSGSTITFDPSFLTSNRVITLTHGELEIADNMTIAGPGAGSLTISGGGNSRVFNVTAQNATVTINDLTIANGNASPANIGAPGNQGGDIFNGGILTLNNDVVENGLAFGNPVGPQGRGGGIFNAEGSNGAGATLTLNTTIVESNIAEGIAGSPNVAGGLGAGGGIYNDT
ncbi:MAG: hypothetical protein ACRELF_08495, partial [Gemmataceae bacterium]